jgi:acetyltransferase-like isoleucine patch superfamily enzyme
MIRPIKRLIRLVIDQFVFRVIYKKLPYYQDAHITIGKYTYGITYNTISLFKDTDSVSIGNFCSFAPEVRVVASGVHNIKAVSTYPLVSNLLKRGRERDTLTKGPIQIGNDVWIGYRATILSGVKIGDGAVIGAGAIVTSDIPPYAVAFGIPAKVIKYRFSQEAISSLLKIKWWEWEEGKIKEYLDDFYGDVDSFISKHLS